MKKSDKKMVEEMLRHLQPLKTPEQMAEEAVERIYKMKPTNEQEGEI
jgi:hypothetical protein